MFHSPHAQIPSVADCRTSSVRRAIAEQLHWAATTFQSPQHKQGNNAQGAAILSAKSVSRPGSWRVSRLSSVQNEQARIWQASVTSTVW
jgi:hypothetical protein